VRASWSAAMRAATWVGALTRDADIQQPCDAVVQFCRQGSDLGLGDRRTLCEVDQLNPLPRHQGRAGHPAGTQFQPDDDIARWELPVSQMPPGRETARGQIGENPLSHQALQLVRVYPGLIIARHLADGQVGQADLLATDYVIRHGDGLPVPGRRRVQGGGPKRPQHDEQYPQRDQPRAAARTQLDSLGRYCGGFGHFIVPSSWRKDRVGSSRCGSSAGSRTFHVFRVA